MERLESDYSEDFEEEELSSAALPSSKPSAGSLSVRRRHGGLGPERGVERARQSEIYQFREDRYATLRGQQALERQPITTSKSTGAGRRPVAEDVKLSRRTQSFLPRKLKPKEKDSKFVMSSPARDRQLSALNHTVRGLQNKLSEKGKQLEEVSKENRLLNRLQRRQDREWSRIQRQEDELPQILQRHEQEVRALRKQLRKSHEEVMVSQQRLGELQDEVRRLTDTNHKLERVARNKRLLERDQLTVQLEQTKQQLTDREKRVAELERGLEASSKTHQQEVRGLQLRNRALATENNSLRDTANELKTQLKEKTKEMNVLNIYTQRIPRNPAKPLPLSPQPLTPVAVPSVAHQASQTSLSCPPFKTVSMQHRSQLKAASSQTDMVKASHCMDTATQTPHEKDSVPAAPADNTAVEQSPTQNTAKIPPAVGGAMSSETAANHVQAQESKHVLIQKLRELDSQKSAPGCDPVAPVQTSGFATVVTTTTTQPPPLQPIVVSTALPLDTNPPVSVAAQEQEKKQLLLAKLMAIDEGSDPNFVATTPKSSQKQPPPLETKPINSHTGSKITSSGSSITSWHEVIENMHHGKPAYASEDDPFGSRTRLNCTKKTLAKGKVAVEDVRGRRSTGVRGQATFMTETSEPISSAVEDKWKLGESRVQAGRDGSDYKPSFGRRATNAEPKPNVPRGQAEDHTHLPRDTIATEHLVFGESAGMAGRGGLLPRRPKAEPAAMRSDDVMPGAIVSEPDDLEELVL